MYNKPVQQMAQTVSGGFETSSNGATSHGGRSVLSIKNAAEVIKRKGSFQGNGNAISNACELRVNINKAYQQPNQGDQVVGAVAAPAVVPGHQQAIIPQVRNGKNIPNGLLRRATGGQQGRQKSIGHLSNYQPNGNPNHKRSTGHGDTSYPEIDSQGGSIGRVGLPRNESIEEIRTQSNSHSLFKHKNSGPSSSSKPTTSSTVVNPPMIIQPSSSSNFQNAKAQGNVINTHVAPFSVHVESMNPTHQNNQSSLSSTKNTLLKMAANSRIQSTERN